MTERYDELAAAHYSAYRPPLHQLILGRVLSNDGPFSSGLDVGCGTGYSALALADYCDRVYAIDPSLSMLRKAIPHTRVFYAAGEAEHIPLQTGFVDIATFAGSLFYADSIETRDEVITVCHRGAVIVAYDFEILLGEVLERCEVAAYASVSGYDHRANFSPRDGLTEVAVGSDRVSLHMTAEQLAHVVLSDSHRFDQLANRYKTADPFFALVAELRHDTVLIEADIYYSKYHAPMS